MSLFDAVLGVFAPHECLGCRSEGQLICKSCLERLAPIAPRCYRCHRLSDGARTCRSCRSTSLLRRVQVATVYEDIAKQLVWRLKYASAKSAADEMADILRGAITLAPTERYLLVPVPTTTKRARQRGYDQAQLLTKALSRRTGLPWRNGLRRYGRIHQVGANRQGRLSQLEGVFVARNLPDASRLTIVLVDDVVTTGATLEAAAKAFKRIGARRVEAIVFAQP